MATKKQGSGPSDEPAPKKAAKRSSPKEPDTPKTAKRGSSAKPAPKKAAEPSPPEEPKAPKTPKQGSTSEPAPPKTSKRSSSDEPAAPKASKRSSGGEGRFHSVDDLLARVAKDQGLDRDDVSLNQDNRIVVEGVVTGWKAVVSETATGQVWTVSQQSPPETSHSATGGPGALRPTRRNPYNGAIFPSTDDLLTHIAYHQEVEEDEISLAADNRIVVKHQVTGWKAAEIETEEGTLWTVREVEGLDFS